MVKKQSIKKHRANKTHLMAVMFTAGGILSLASCGVAAAAKIESVADNMVLYAGLLVFFAAAGLALIWYVKNKNDHIFGNEAEAWGKNKEQLDYMAFHDSLTGLPNRAHLEELMKNKMTGAEKEQLALVFIGLDDFKKINDTLGHMLGDALLKEVALRLLSISDEHAKVMRFGGDEFVMLLGERKALAGFESYINVIQSCFEQRFEVSGNSVHMTASIGYAIYPEHTADYKTLLQFADMAMYQAKSSGKNKVIQFEQSINNTMQNRMALEQKIVNAIREEKFEMYYQPQFDFHNNRFRGFEALVRWHDEELGWISPGTFIPIAEETGYILELGEWILREVCKTWTRWKEEFEQCGKVSVNISAVQLTRQDFVDMVKATIKEFGINPRELELEITETVLIDDLGMIKDTLNSLKDLGISLSLDDFGTGYSSLTYLKDLPIDTLKIDRSFISNITVNNRQAEITDALIDLVHKLNMETIAEGVETQEQYDFLRYMKCDNIQGYLTGRPMDTFHAEALLSRQHYPEIMISRQCYA